MLNKHPCSIRAWVPVSFFLFLSLSQANSLEHGWLLSSLSCPGLQDPHERVPCAYVKQCRPLVKGFIGFLCKPRNISLFLSLFYFLIVNSGPPGSDPLKDLNRDENPSPTVSTTGGCPRLRCPHISSLLTRPRRLAQTVHALRHSFFAPGT